MTFEEIADLFIKGAMIDHRLPDTARPARLKAQNIAYVHDAKDQKGWGGDRYQEERASFWESASTRLQASDVSQWERCNDLIKLVANEGNRRALWHWAIAKAGGKPFAKWCRSEGIHEMTGKRRRNRAIAVIEQHLTRSGSQNPENWDLTMLPVGPVFEHISDNIAAPPGNKMKPETWRSDLAFQPIGDEAFRDFDWAAARNEARRHREAKKRQAA